MKREEREKQLQELREAQMSLMDVMSASDAHASKCIKLGLNFKMSTRVNMTHTRRRGSHIMPMKLGLPNWRTCR